MTFASVNMSAARCLICMTRSQDPTIHIKVSRANRRSLGEQHTVVQAQSNSRLQKCKELLSGQVGLSQPDTLTMSLAHVECNSATLNVAASATQLACNADAICQP
jgi:hypothetical protein